MGATVIGMSHNDKKRDVAAELGCDDYINTANTEDMQRYRKKLTHILCTGNGRDFKCKFLNIGLLEENINSFILYV